MGASMSLRSGLSSYFGRRLLLGHVRSGMTEISDAYNHIRDTARSDRLSKAKVKAAWEGHSEAEGRRLFEADLARSGMSEAGLAGFVRERQRTVSLMLALCGLSVLAPLAFWAITGWASPLLMGVVGLFFAGGIAVIHAHAGFQARERRIVGMREWLRIAITG
ncbi:MAG: hypothetical protein DI629_17575 [Mesorhizobium amorphae]|nr:MAG: hypothetical protein DI629_17575 [Mesorhizobium amorphae]